MASESVLLINANLKNLERFPMKWMFLLLLFLPTVTIAQHAVVVNVDSALVKADRSDRSSTVRVVYYGQELIYSATINGWLILEGGGYIKGVNVLAKELFVERVGELGSMRLKTKNPEDYTQKELQYLLLKAEIDYHKSDLKIKKARNIVAGVGVFVLAVYTAQYLILAN